MREKAEKRLRKTCKGRAAFKRPDISVFPLLIIEPQNTAISKGEIARDFDEMRLWNVSLAGPYTSIGRVWEGRPAAKTQPAIYGEQTFKTF